MQIFSPLGQLGSQPVPGSITWDSEVESESGNTFDACFSEMLSAGDDVDKDACSGASRQTSEQMKAEEPDTNREDFSPARNHDKAQARENVAGSDTQPDAQDTLLSHASTTSEDDLNKLMDQLVALLQGGSREQVVPAQSGAKEQGKFSLENAGSFLEGENQQILNLVDDTGELKDVLRRLEQVLAARDGGDMSGSGLERKMQVMDFSTEDMVEIRDMLRSILGTVDRSMVQTGVHPVNEQIQSEGDAKAALTADNRALQSLLNDKVQMDVDSKQVADKEIKNGAQEVPDQATFSGKGTDEQQRFFPEKSNSIDQASLRDPGDRVNTKDLQNENPGFADQKSSSSERETSGDPGFANTKDHAAKTPETSSRSNGLLAQTILENESLDQPGTTTRSNVSRNVLDQVQQGVFRNLGQGRKQLSLQLDPADLGTVNVILQVKGKEVNAVLKTSHEDTSRILNEQMVQLKDHLEKQGLKVVKLEVQNQMASDEQPGQWGGGSQHNQSRERLEAGMRELRWRSLRGEGEVLARDVQNGEHRVNVSPRGVDFFA